MEQATNELNKYQNVMSQRQPQSTSTASATPSFSQNSSPQLFQPPSTGSYMMDSPASTLDVFTLGICFAPDESDHGAAPYELGDIRVSRLAIAELFSE
jgi:hypothetical protein